MAKVKKTQALGASSKAVDPTLDALFASSAGPVKAPPVAKYSQPAKKKVVAEPSQDPEDEDEGDDEELSEISEELDYDDGDGEEGENGGEGEEEESEEADQAKRTSDAGVEGTDTVMADSEPPVSEETNRPRRERKRKRKNDNDDLEDKYLAELTKEDAAEPTGKRLKGEEPEDDQTEDKDDSDDDKIPVHESLAQESKTSDIEKAARTVFLANVASEAISSKSARKTLMNHLSSVFDKEESSSKKIESIRFRSVAFSTGSMPKRAAYITGALMEATTKSANAYVVYPDPVSARKAVSELNGTQVLDRHIRVDSVAHPSPTAHRRCIFVGNLGFVDDETMLSTTSEGDQVQKKRNKVPADVEEGLWRTFGKQGRVENVRVVRDPKTRVGKGFAYVQFYDANDVEGALLLDGKKFPPMLPRALRVTRAKDPRKTALAQERSKAKTMSGFKKGQDKDTKYKRKITSEEQSMVGRAGRLLGRAGAAQQRRDLKGPRKPVSDDALGAIKTPEQIVFEGKRASVKDGLTKDSKKGKKKFGRSSRPEGRSARRAADWKKKKT